MINNKYKKEIEMTKLASRSKLAGKQTPKKLT